MSYVLDSSAVVAIVRREPTADALLAVLTASTGHVVGTPTLVETFIVLQARAPEGGQEAAVRLLAALEVQPVVFAPEHVAFAFAAFRDYGKGRHPAALNLGDCFTYAIAKASGRAIVCVGEDFAQTDIATVRP